MNFQVGVLQVYCPKCEVWIGLEQAKITVNSGSAMRDEILYSCPKCDEVLAVRKILGVE